MEKYMNLDHSLENISDYLSNQSYKWHAGWYITDDER